MNDQILKVMELVQQKTAKATERAIMDQLGELVSRGLLVVEISECVLHQYLDPDQDKMKFDIARKVILKLKDQEYIEKLEKRVEDLTALVGKVER